jgi:hypothetical protein
MVVDLSMKLGWSVDDAEDRYTLEQVILLWYLDVKRERRDQELSAQMTAAYLAKFFSGG